MTAREALEQMPWRNGFRSVTGTSPEGERCFAFQKEGEASVYYVAVVGGHLFPLPRAVNLNRRLDWQPEEMKRDRPPNSGQAAAAGSR